MRNKILWLLVIGLLLRFVGNGECDPYTVKEICRAIGRVENSEKYPYGIQSINTYGDKEYARKLCIQSIVNNYKRWDKQGDFLEFMGKRYCPPNWERWAVMVKYWLVRYKEEQ